MEGVTGSCDSAAVVIGDAAKDGDGQKLSLDVDPCEQLTDGEDSVDHDHWTDGEDSTDHVDEIDEEDASTQTDDTQDILPFAGFANAGTGKLAPVPTDEDLARAKKLFGVDITELQSSSTENGKIMYPNEEICFRRASSGEKWL